MYGIRFFQVVHAEQFKGSLTVVAAEQLLRSCQENPHAVCVLQAMASVSAIQFRHNGLLRSVHDWLCTHYRHIPLSSIPPLMAGLHTFNAATDQLIECTSTVLSSNLHMFSASDRGKLCQLLWVFGTTSVAVQSEALMNAAARRMMHTGIALVPAGSLLAYVPACTCYVGKGMKLVQRCSDLYFFPVWRSY